jgi:hypothetical protein
MADFRAIFGDDDSENEEFLGFDLDDIKEAEEKYVQQLNVLDDLDSDIEFSEMGSSDIFNKGKMKHKLFFYWPVLKESWIFPFI